MAWDPEKKGSYAWMSQEASRHGGVEEYINDIHKEGYQEGYDKGVVDGVIIFTVVTTILGGVKFAVDKINKRRKKKYEIIEQSKKAKSEIRNIFREESDLYEEDEN